MRKLVFTTQHSLATDPNARFHQLTGTWTSGAIATAAFLIVSPLAPAVELPNSVSPLALAALAATLLGLAFNATERWLVSKKAPWALAQDGIDIRQIIVVLFSALIPWVVVLINDFVHSLSPGNGTFEKNFAGFGAFVAAWLILWFISTRIWGR